MPRSKRQVAALALLSVVLASCHALPEPVASPALVRVVQVKPRTLTETLPAAGPLVPPQGSDVTLGALVAGRVSELPVAEGDVVKAKQLLARIEPTPFLDALSQAEAQLEQAHAQRANDEHRLDRSEKLVQAGIAAKQELDDARAQAVTSKAAEQSALAAVSSAKNQLARTELRAPFAGQVAHVFAVAGEPVDGSGKPLVEVTRTEILELRASIPATAASRVQPGQKAIVTVNGVAEPREGEVIAVSPLVSPTTGTATVRIRLQNQDGVLKGGQMAQAQIALATHQGVLAVPETALVPAAQSGGNAAAAAASAGPEALAVEVVLPDGTVRRQAVEVGLRGEGYAELRSGVRAGDPVVVQGAYALPDGAKVKSQNAPDEEAPRAFPEVPLPGTTP